MALGELMILKKTTVDLLSRIDSIKPSQGKSVTNKASESDLHATSLRDINVFSESFDQH